MSRREAVLRWSVRVAFWLAFFYLLFTTLAQASAWDAPSLTSPVTIDLSTQMPTNGSFALPQSQDYRFTCSSGKAVVPAGFHLSIWGGNHDVFEHCVVYSGDGEAFYPHNQGSEFWLHDLDFVSASGAGTPLGQGIQVQEPGQVTMVMRDILFGSLLEGAHGSNHAEFIQTWSGPQRLLIDGLTGATTYQGLYLLPNQQDTKTTETQYDLRNVDIAGAGAYDYWLTDQFGPFPLNTQNLYDCTPSGVPRTYGWVGGSDWNPPEATAWPAVQSCPTPSGGHYVWLQPDGTVYGIDEPGQPAPLPGE